jgi:hypothetical protein
MAYLEPWEDSMKKPSKNPQIRRHIRDKAIIDHLTSGPAKPEMAPPRAKEQRVFTEENGRTLHKALGEEWTPDKGGLSRL